RLDAPAAPDRSARSRGELDAKLREFRLENICRGLVPPASRAFAGESAGGSRIARDPARARAGQSPAPTNTGMSTSGRLNERVLLALEYLAHRRTLQHAIFPGRVVLEILDRQLDAVAPGIEDQRVGVAGGELRALQPLLAGEQPVDLLEIGEERLLAGFLDAGMRALIRREALGPEDMREAGMHRVRQPRHRRDAAHLAEEIPRHQVLLGEAAGEIGEDRRVLGDDVVADLERRHL